MSQIGPVLDWRFAVALALLLAAAVGAAAAGRLRIATRNLTASVRAVVQLLVVAGIIRLALEHVWSAFLFVAMMLTVATATSAGRVGVRPVWWWVALALVAGEAPVLTVIFGSGASPLNPPSIVALCGIVIGGTMTACSLAARRSFATLRSRVGEVEAAMALGIPRSRAIGLVIDPDRPEALVPILDQTRTVGLVTLPGAFVGVLLGGGSTAQAAAAQLVVLVGLLAAETITVVVAGRLVAAGRMLPTDVREGLPPG